MRGKKGNLRQSKEKTGNLKKGGANIKLKITLKKFVRIDLSQYL